MISALILVTVSADFIIFIKAIIADMQIANAGNIIIGVPLLTLVAEHIIFIAATLANLYRVAISIVDRAENVAVESLAALLADEFFTAVIAIQTHACFTATAYTKPISANGDRLTVVIVIYA